MKLSEKRCKFSSMLCDLIKWGNQEGLQIAIAEVLRTKEQQELYIKLGKSKTMNSKHLDGLGADLIVYINGVYQPNKPAYEKLGQKWKSMDTENVWGGDWGWDANHFQYSK